MHLIKTKHDGKPSGFAKKIELQPSYVSRITSGKRGVGHKLAHEIERAYGLKRFKLDTPLDADASGVEHDKSLTLQDQLVWFFDRLSQERRDSLVQLASRFYIEEHPGPASVINPFPDAPPPIPSVAARPRRKQ